MKNKFFCVISIIIFILALSVTSNAQENKKIYNKKQEVVLSHDLFNHNGQYYIHIEDLQQLGLNVNKDNYTYTITSNDYLGEERKLVIEAWTIVSGLGPGTIKPFDGVYTPNTLSDTESVTEETIYTVTSKIKYTRRNIKIIGHTNDLPLTYDMDTIPYSSNDAMIRVNKDYYISTRIIGEKMSHYYSDGVNKIEFNIADSSSMMIDTTLNLILNKKAPPGGQKVNVHAAYKIGDGEEIDDFEILSTKTLTIPENENSISGFIEIPADKINNNNIYYIADFGGRYALAYSEYDISKLGRVLVYGEQKDVTYTVNVNLPDIADRDVFFTVYVRANDATYQKTGYIKNGDSSTSLRVTDLPLAETYSSRIEFNYHKYKNAYLNDIRFLYSWSAVDFETEFTAQLSKEVICTVTLPYDYVCEDDIEIKFTLQRFVGNNSLVVVDSLKDWSHSEVIILNNENRSEQVHLYNQTEVSMLSYEIRGNVGGLCKEGYLCTTYGKLTSDKNSTIRITENLVTDITLLEKRNITVEVSRPSGLSLDNDIFASVEIFENSKSSLSIIDFTKTPLIPAGSYKSQFTFEAVEGKVYELMITNITGDDRLFNYCSYVDDNLSVAQEGWEKSIWYDDGIICLTLLECINLTGIVKSDKTDLNFQVLASCKLNNGNYLSLWADPINGEFSFKIPEDTNTYTISVISDVFKKSYYISDGISSNLKEEATQILYQDGIDKEIVLEYIVQNPLLPIEISKEDKYNFFMLENISDYLIEQIDAYVAYYDIDGILISVKKTEYNDLASGKYLKMSRDISNYEIKKAKAFVWKRNDMTPLSNTAEEIVNMP